MSIAAVHEFTPLPSDPFQDDYVHALVDGESLCTELAEARREEEVAREGLEKVSYFRWCVPEDRKGRNTTDTGDTWDAS